MVNFPGRPNFEPLLRIQAGTIAGFRCGPDRAPIDPVGIDGESIFCPLSIRVTNWIKRPPDQESSAVGRNEFGGRAKQIQRKQDL